MIGNAVPINLAYEMAKAIMKSLNNLNENVDKTSTQFEREIENE